VNALKILLEAPINNTQEFQDKLRLIDLEIQKIERSRGMLGNRFARLENRSLWFDSTLKQLTEQLDPNLYSRAVQRGLTDLQKATSLRANARKSGCASRCFNISEGKL